MRTRESEGEKQGGAWRLRASRRKQEVARGKQEVAEASRARATPRLCSSSWQRRKRTRGRRWAGPAGGAGPDGALGGAAGKARWACSFLFFFVLCSVLTLFSILQVCFEFGFETNSIYFASDNIFRS